MTLRSSRNNEFFTPSLGVGGSSSAFSSPVPTHNGFSTRTRLRPGGPAPHLDNPRSTSTATTHSTLRNGSLEEIGMRTLHHSPTSQANNQFLLNRRPYFSTMMKGPISANTHHPSTPLVKQKTSGCSSPRVQMYRTRVVYSDARDAIKAAQEAAV